MQEITHTSRQKLTDDDSDLKGRASFIAYPEQGGRIDELVLYQDDLPVSVLRSLGSEAQVRSDQTYNNTLLFPFANRLEMGKYEFEGNEYRFPVNDQQTNFHSALHGLLYNHVFEVTDSRKSDDGSFKKLDLRAQIGKSDFASYPFEVELLASYRIINNHAFRVEFLLRNLGNQNAPAGFGWHPYFTLDHPVDELYLRMPEADQIEVDKNLIPTGIKTSFNRFSGELRPLNSENFDTCFQLNGDGPFETTLVSPVQNISLSIRQSSTLPYLQIFIPGDRKSIAIEPVSSNINAFRNKEGLIVLKPGETVSAWIELSVAKAASP